ncbi:MAG: hypothetical protein HQK72_09970 [Desulfamplus sp.]|nr:hypothetical protein [Desulfamplus sp.]
MQNNPKIHDALTKWLIASFTDEFFAHYFPKRIIGKHTFIDKEFISKYEALKESLKDDLFLIMEMEIDGVLSEVVIQIEHKSKKEDVSERIYEYMCYAWLLKRKPVWSIAIYTDDAIWRKKLPESFWYGFSDKKGKQSCHFDVIKVKGEKSEDLIKKHSLMCKLLALKADDRGIEREYIIREIYMAAAAMGKNLDNEKKLLVEQWVSAYKELPEETVQKIKKEVKMTFTATTISEHYINEGRLEGIKEGKLEGKLEGIKEGKLEGKLEGIKEGEIKGQIKLLESLLLSGVLTSEKYYEMVAPLKKQLESIGSIKNN